jgi:hypothetical protein
VSHALDARGQLEPAAGNRAVQQQHKLLPFRRACAPPFAAAMGAIVIASGGNQHNEYLRSECLLYVQSIGLMMRWSLYVLCV